MASYAHSFSPLRSGSPRLRASSYSRRSLVIVAFLFATAFLVFHVHTQSYHGVLFKQDSKVSELGPANSTLGFGAIVAVAAPTYPEEQKWRLPGLKKAAALTGLDYSISKQPKTYKADAQKLAEKFGALQPGDALSWVGHLAAIREAQQHPTALIIEDDVDWDVNIRQQMPEIASAIRTLSSDDKEIPGLDTALHPYGENWDVLWLGHCGDLIPPKKPYLRFADPLVPPFTNSWEKTVAPDPDHMRWVHHSTGPICTFAYAISQRTATHILESGDLGKFAFDVWLHIRCKGQKLRCFTVNPELFHHHELAGPRTSMIQGPTKDIVHKDHTKNVWHSARCNVDNKGDELVTCMGPDEREDSSEGTND